MKKFIVLVAVGTVIEINLNFALFMLLGRLIGYLALPFGYFIPVVSGAILFILLTPLKLASKEKLKIVLLAVILSLITVPLFKFVTIFASGRGNTSLPTY